MDGMELCEIPEGREVTRRGKAYACENATERHWGPGLGWAVGGGWMATAVRHQHIHHHIPQPCICPSFLPSIRQSFNSPLHPSTVQHQHSRPIAPPLQVYHLSHTVPAIVPIGPSLPSSAHETGPARTHGIRPPPAQPRPRARGLPDRRKLHLRRRGHARVPQLGAHTPHIVSRLR